MPQPAAIVTRPSLGGTLRDHRNRLKGTEAPSPGKWVYVLPIAPATPPPDLVPDDPLAPDFQNGWGNNAGDEQAVSFRIHPATKVEIRGGIAGGTLGTVVFTLPDGFRPALPVPVVFPSRAGTSVFTGRVDPNGDVTILEEIAAPAPGSSFVPIGDPTGEDESIVYTDPASGNPVTTMTFPADTTVMAWGKTGDAFPRVVLRVDPGEYALALGDGTIDPWSSGGVVYYVPGSGLWLYDIFQSSAVFAGFPDAVVGPVSGCSAGFRLGQNANQAILSSGQSDPNGAVAGNVGDRWFRTDYTGLPLTNDYVCTTAGDAATAVWAGYA